MECLFRDCFAIAKNAGREAEGVRGNSGERSSEEFVANLAKTVLDVCRQKFIRLHRAGYVSGFYSEYFLRLGTKTIGMDMSDNCVIR